MEFNSDKNTYMFETSGKLFHAKNACLGLVADGGKLVVMEGGSRFADVKDLSEAEKYELLEEMFTQWLWWAGVPDGRSVAQLAVAFAMHRDRGGSLPAFAPKEP